MQVRPFFQNIQLIQVKILRLKYYKLFRQFAVGYEHPYLWIDYLRRNLDLSVLKLSLTSWHLARHGSRQVDLEYKL